MLLYEETSSENLEGNELIYHLESSRKLGYIFIVAQFFAKVSIGTSTKSKPLKSYKENLFVGWWKQKKKDF